MGLDSQSNSNYNTGLFMSDLDRSPEKLEHLGTPRLQYKPTFDYEPKQEENWQSKAICNGLTNLFYGPIAERPQARDRRERQAKQICDECPVVKQCLEFALENDEYGFWGGKSEEERRTLTGRLPSTRYRAS
jgi:WhiB family redox-sensing transcriptional regulator